MRIVSLNAWGGAMSDVLLPWLASCDADVVCLQEVTRTPGLAGWTTFADGDRTLPQRADLFADAAGALSGHQGHFLTSDSGPVTDEEGRSWQQDFGIATFVHGRMPMIGTASTFVHGTYTVHDDWAVENRPRGAHAVRVVDRERRTTFTIAHLHGLRDPAGKGDTPARRTQAERLAAFVTAARGAGDDVIVCGDLNLLPDSATFDVLADIGLVDLVGQADTRTSRYEKPVRHASYLLVSDVAAVKHFEIVRGPEVSDHRALVLDL